MIADITMLQRLRASSSTLDNNSDSMNQLQPTSTLSLVSLFPFISISAPELCPFQLCSTHSTEKLPHTLLAPVCSPHSLSGIKGNPNFLANSSFGCSTFPCVVGSNHSGRFPNDSFLDFGLCLLDFWCN
jgi:hypothetical protein